MAINWLPLSMDATKHGVQIYQSNKRQKEYNKKQADNMLRINQLKASRAEIPDLSEPIQDLSGTLSNPYANLSVATKAAEIQMEQSDIALANTLDTIRATGMGAGGATALAQAALQSKNAVAASIETQEAKNAELAAKGQQDLEFLQMQEKQRVQAAEVDALTYSFEAQEARTNADLDFEAGLQQRYEQMEYDARLQKEQQINQATAEITTGFKEGDYFK
jgi:hypothetical protein